ncbi:MAG: GIY-YIG nuclease family protein [Desulfobulbaceae bacterium]|nr:GIY-YIG nuclease family protein [Desulfobulbaceae bacterium]
MYLICHTRENGYPVINMKYFYVYILSSKRNGTLYTGMTSNLIKRTYEHKNGMVEGFTKKYRVHNLVWYEVHESAESAIRREKQIKKWQREWKMKLIEKDNPGWLDLFETISG